jgi:hypothetical protein
VTSASLQVDATTAQIDNEIAQAVELRDQLRDKRDNQLNLLNLSGILTGGALGVASSALQLSSRSGSGNVVGIVAGVATSGLSAVGLRAQKGKQHPFLFGSNMLAPVFHRPAERVDTYPPAVWSFLNAVAPTDRDGFTRLQRLIHTWIEVARIDDPNSAKGADKVRRVTSAPADHLKLTIDDLDDRQAMLGDLRAKLSFMKRDLAILLSTLHNP